MHFKLIIALVEENATNSVMEAARNAGATGSTLISQARGEGLQPTKTFLGLTLETHRDVLLFLVEEHTSRKILEGISKTAGFDEKAGTGIAFQIDVEDAVGVANQIESLSSVVEEEI